MKIKITKTGRTVLLVILGILVLGGGGYLLWRVNQTDTVAPTDSDAGSGGNGGGCCLASYVGGNWICPTGTWEARCEANPGDSVACFCKDKYEVNNCGDNYYCLGDSRSEAGTCNVCEGTPLPPEQDCYAGSDCPACEYPNVGFCISGKCVCKPWNTKDPVPQPCEDEGDTFNCNAKCPTGKVSCTQGEEDCTEVREDCACTVCKNKSYDTIWCKDATEENTCEQGSWAEQPTGKKTYCSKFSARASAVDTDGIDPDSIEVTLSGTPLEQCGSNPTTTCYQLNEVSSTETRIIVNVNEYTCLAEGDYTINMSWSDNEGNTGETCELTTTFEMEGQIIEGTCGDGILGNTSGEQCELGDPDGVTCAWSTCNQTTCTCPDENPDWEITKAAVETCIEDGDDVEGRATYTITVSNTGDANGNMDRIVDNLDSKVIADYLNSISDDGIYSNGQITWDLEGEDEVFSPNETQTFTYYIQVPESGFGTYENTVTAYPSEGDSLSAQADVEIDCDVPEIPQTGIFDSSLARIAAGIVLILVGMSWNKINYTVQEYVSDNRIRKFENKVAKKS